MIGNRDGSVGVSTSDDGRIVYVTLHGRPSREALESGAAEVKEAVSRLREEFGVITDLTDFEPLSPDETEPIKSAQQYVADQGANDVGRVVDDDTSRVTLMSFRLGSREGGYEGKTAETISEAERLIEV